MLSKPGYDVEAAIRDMDPVAFRIKNLPPTAPNAMWAPYLREGAAEFGGVTSASYAACSRTTATSPSTRSSRR